MSGDMRHPSGHGPAQGPGPGLGPGLGLGLGLSMRQTQKLVMTPELRLALQVLQFSTADLAERIQEELLANPVLEVREEPEAQALGEPVPIHETPAADNDAARENDRILDYFLDGSDLGVPPAPRRDPSDYARPLDPPITQPLTLQEHLLQQLRLTIRDGDADQGDVQPRVVEYLIGCLDERGYLVCDPDDAATFLGVETRRIEEGITLLQSFDPRGIGARNLRECLSLQLVGPTDQGDRGGPGDQGGRDDQGRRDDQSGRDGQGGGETSSRHLALAIIQDHLEDLAAGRLSRISAALKVELPQIQSAVDLIRSLEPKPARAFAGQAEANRYIIPDAIVEKLAGSPGFADGVGDTGDRYIVVMNDSALPRLGVNQFYRQLLRKTLGAVSRSSRPGTSGTAAGTAAGTATGAATPGSGSATPDGATAEAARFLHDRLTSAVWFIRSIEQRRLTLYRVVEAVASLQSDFLDRGIRYLRPLTMKDVAEAIGVHESTVSRAVANKYVQTPHGVFELKFFFSSGVDRLGGQGIASESVKKLIGDLVSKEDPGDPLSDQRLAELLSGSGVVISRRTVAKYREEAGIPSSSRRKRY